jgi:hypothetical protein
MRKVIPLPLIVLLVATGCGKSSNSTPAPTASTAANVDDPVEKKLQEPAGGSAVNCGHLKAQVPADMDTAGKCVMQDAQQKKPFYVAYEMPGMIVAIAGTPEGKLFSLQTQPSVTGGFATVPCPNELRIAPSGRATCYSPGTFPMGMGGGMSTPPA